MGRGRGDGSGSGNAVPRRGGGEEESLNHDGIYASPVAKTRDAEHEGVSIDTYSYGGQATDLRSSSPPVTLDGGRVRIFEDHEVYAPSGAWIGADRPVPHRRMTNGALTELGPEMVKELFDRYESGDYGAGEDGGELGFALYRIDGHVVYLIDDATRSLEGEPPLRDPATSPGPQTVLLSHEY